MFLGKNGGRCKIENTRRQVYEKRSGVRGGLCWGVGLALFEKRRRLPCSQCGDGKRINRGEIPSSTCLGALRQTSLSRHSHRSQVSPWKRRLLRGWGWRGANKRQSWTFFHGLWREGEGNRASCVQRGGSGKAGAGTRQIGRGNVEIDEIGEIVAEFVNTLLFTQGLEGSS